MKSEPFKIAGWPIPLWVCAFFGIMVGTIIGQIITRALGWT